MGDIEAVQHDTSTTGGLPIPYSCRTHLLHTFPRTVLQALITHLQYFIIITKLAIDYPPMITKFQSVLGAVTGTENYIAYSPSCLFKGLESAGQAASQVAFGLAAPCVATLVTVILWAIRFVPAR